ncbi:MAG: hypothetical protein Q9222_004487 [Ikaeria aurantiellina]
MNRAPPMRVITGANQIPVARKLSAATPNNLPPKPLFFGGMRSGNLATVGDGCEARSIKQEKPERAVYQPPMLRDVTVPKQEEAVFPRVPLGPSLQSCPRASQKPIARSSTFSRPRMPADVQAEMGSLKQDIKYAKTIGDTGALKKMRSRYVELHKINKGMIAEQQRSRSNQAVSPACGFARRRAWVRGHTKVGAQDAPNTTGTLITKQHTSGDVRPENPIEAIAKAITETSSLAKQIEHLNEVLMMHESQAALDGLGSALLASAESLLTEAQKVAHSVARDGSYQHDAAHGSDHEFGTVIKEEPSDMQFGEKNFPCYDEEGSEEGEWVAHLP